MSAIRTALALGALTMSLPVIAQDSRYGQDRSRVEGSRDARVRSDKSGGGRGAGRSDKRGEDRSSVRGESRPDNRSQPRAESRGEPRPGERNNGRAEGRVGGVPDRQWDRRDPRDAPRVAWRPPVVVERYDHRDGRFDGRFIPPGHRVSYRYGDRDFRHRDVVTIGAWFRALSPARLTAYGYYGPDYAGVRYVFRPGLYLSLAVYTRLERLPFDLELELGELPWYLERRIYGNTVLVIDTRARLVVDMFDLDY